MFITPLNTRVYQSTQYPCVSLVAMATFAKATNGIYMWQSRVEIEGYSIAYFDCIVAFEVPYR